MSAARPDLPTGTVTFLRTDVEGSMRLARALGVAWDELNVQQQTMVRDAVEAHGGVAVRTEGDAVFAVFREALPAILAAVELQRSLTEHAWPDGAPVRVRVGVHTGEAHHAGDDYGGFEVNRAARIAAVGHGGQIVLSDPTRALVEAELPTGASVRDLGRHALKDVPQPERLFQLDAPGLATEFPPIRTGSTSAGNLPPRLTSFIAREPELQALAALLAGTRLVTITGPGGIGKTSLAIELARGQADAFPDGAWTVPLDAVAEPAGVSAAIARTLAIYDGPGRPVIDGLIHFLAERRALLVLDNFEHLLEAAGDVATLLRGAPALRVVVTSRAALRIPGEQEYPLGVLGATAAANGGADTAAAVRLFVDRAAAVRPDWEPGDDAPIVDDICRMVDRLPLGIELAAARVAMLSPATIRDRLAARLPLPGAGPRDVPARQRTLDGTIAWSYELLSADRRRLVRELAVFDGGFDLDQVGLVATIDAADDPLDALLELADQSLIARSAITGHESGIGGIRFRMLETIRTFALRQLADEGSGVAVRRRHALAMLALVEEAAPHLPGAGQARWLDRLAQDHGNVASALRWAIDAGDVDTAQRLSHATWRYWQIGGHLREGRALADAVIDMPGADEPSPGRMWSFAAAGGLAYWQADAIRSGVLYEAQLEAALQIGHQAGIADASFNLASIRYIEGRAEEGGAHLERARELYRRLGDDRSFARTEWARGNIMQLRDDPAAAVQLLEVAKRGYAASGDATYEALAAGSLAIAHLTLGNRVEAFRLGLEALAINHAIRDVATTTITLAAAAMMLLEFDRNEEAATLMGAFDSLCELHGVQPPAGMGALIFESRVVERAVAALTSEQSAAAVRRGRAMSLDDAVNYVTETFEDVIGEPA